MKVIICKNKKEGANKAALLVAEQIKKKNNLVLGLATGQTMIPFYKELIKTNKRIDFLKVKTFNLDEWCGVDHNNKNSLKSFMDKYFFSKLNISRENINFLNGKSKNIKKECERYEKETNGIDLQILGIGINGHIGFNEPGTPFNSLTNKVKITKEIRELYSQEFGGFSKVPKYGLTIGIKTIMRSKKIILLAFGKSKADAVAKSLNNKSNKKIPASILQKHKDVTFILDKKAASKLE